MGIFVLARSKFNLDDQTQNLNISLFQIVNKRLVFGIGGLRHEGYYVTTSRKAFEGCVLIVDKDCRDLAIFNNILSTDNNNITIKNTGSIHAVTAHAQREVFGTAVEISECVTLNVFLSIDWSTSGNTAENRNSL